MYNPVLAIFQNSQQELTWQDGREKPQNILMGQNFMWCLISLVPKSKVSFFTEVQLYL